MEGANSEVQSNGVEKDKLLGRVVVVQPDPQTLKVFGNSFKPYASTIQLFSQGEDVLRMLESEDEQGIPPVSIVITDYHLPGEKDGVDVIRAIRDKYPDSIRVMYSGKTSDLVRLDREELMTDGVTHMYDPSSRRPSEVVGLLVEETKKRHVKK